MTINTNISLKNIVTLFAVAMFFSCNNTLKEVQANRGNTVPLYDLASKICSVSSNEK